MTGNPALTPAPVVEIAHLNKSYRRGSVVLPVLQDISLTIRQGERVALVGESGGGKTTITRLLTRLVEDLPTHTFRTDDGEVALKCPTEVAITDRREKELSKGLIALGYFTEIKAYI